MTGYLGCVFEIGERRIECSYYITRWECSEPYCSTILLWNDDGREDAAMCFYAENCRCLDMFEEDPKLCCSEHKMTYICPDCTENEEDEEVVATKRRLEELEQEVRSLKQKLEK